MSGDGGGSSVTIWIGDLKNGGDSAAQHLWERYCDKLLALARRDLRRKLPGGGIGDESDAVNSAFDSLCRGVGRGAYPRLDHRDDLWRLLVVLTRRKVADRVRYELAAKRGGGKVVHARDLADEDGDDGSLNPVDGGRVPRGGVWIDADPSPEEVAIQVEEIQRLIDKLGNEKLRAIALAKLEGLTDEEVAERFTRSRKWVQRQKELIREGLREAVDRDVPS
jgi:DNA-directed RNA polymerase specialized sigma24 family protein